MSRIPESLLHPHWHRVAGLRPRLKSDVRFHRHTYRGQRWYLVRDPVSRRAQRLSHAAHRVAALLDGERTLQQVWDTAGEALGDERPTQGETIRLLATLHFADLLVADVAPDTEEVLRRSRRSERGEWLQRLANPLSLRFPLVDPDPWLARVTPFFAPLFSRAGLFAMAALIATAFVLGLASWEALTSDAARELLEPRNLLVVALVYPLLKLVHELGHAITARHYGAEVHEMGIMFLVLLPLPYVDASGASFFPRKQRRAGVAAAGIVVELLMASLALFVWLLAEPGIVRTIAFDIVWIAAGSSLLFNGNPLLKFDGYYVLSDWIEIPNLASRANQYLGYCFQRHVLRLTRVRDPVLDESERAWLARYGLAAGAYRLVILLSISLMLAERLAALGLALAAFSAFTQIVMPVWRQVRFVATAPWIAEERGRAIRLFAAVGAAAALLLMVVPMPSYTTAQGVVWPAEHTHLRAPAEGIVVELLAEPGRPVEAGTPLLRTEDTDRARRVAVLEAKLVELRARERAAGSERVKRQILRSELASTRRELARARERTAEEIVTARHAGTFVLTDGADLVGRYVRQGDALGYLVDESFSLVRVALRDYEAAHVREQSSRIHVRLATQLTRDHRVVIARELPGTSHELPHAALGTSGGGRIPVDPRDEEGRTTLDPIFLVDVALPEEATTTDVGARVFVRFDHGGEPIVIQAGRALRQLFLRHLGA